MRRLAIAIAIVLLLSGCGGTSAASERRIVAAAAGSAAMLSEMGLGADIVAVDERNAVSSFATLPVVSAGHSLNIEVLLSVNPTIVLVDDLVGPASAIADLSQRGIDVVSIDTAADLGGIARKYKQLGAALNAEQAAQRAADDFAAKLAEFSASAKPWRIAFLYIRGTNAIYLVGGRGSGADALIKTVGSTDVGAQVLSDPFTPLSAEVMARLNPQVLLVMTSGLASVGGLDGLRDLPGIAQTEAGRVGRVVTVDDRTLLEFGPETLGVLSSMSEQLSKYAVSV